MTGRRPKAATKATPAPRESKAEQDRRIAARSLAWASRTAVITGVGVLVAIAAIVVPIV